MEFFDIIWVVAILGGVVKFIAKFIESDKEEEGIMGTITSIILDDENDEDEEDNAMYDEEKTPATSDKQIFNDALYNQEFGSDFEEDKRKKEDDNNTHEEFLLKRENLEERKEGSFKKRDRRRKKKVKNKTLENDLISDISEEDLIKGIIFKEILDEPRAKRPHRSIYKDEIK
ncbi:hypothetical protein [Natronospora cellulosivora (SeqCode)]